MAGLVFSAVVLGILYFRGCTFGALTFSGFVLFFLAALSASWVAATVSICLLISAVALPLTVEDPQRRMKFLGIIVSIGLLLACVLVGERALHRIQLRDQYPYVSLRDRTQVVNQVQSLAGHRKVPNCLANGENSPI